MEHKEMKPSEKVKRRNNIIVGCSIALIAIAMYSAAIYFGVGKA